MPWQLKFACTTSFLVSYKMKGLVPIASNLGSAWCYIRSASSTASFWHLELRTPDMDAFDFQTGLRPCSPCHLKTGNTLWEHLSISLIWQVPLASCKLLNIAFIGINKLLFPGIYCSTLSALFKFKIQEGLKDGFGVGRLWSKEHMRARASLQLLKSMQVTWPRLMPPFWSITWDWLQWSLKA